MISGCSGRRQRTPSMPSDLMFSFGMVRIPGGALHSDSLFFLTSSAPISHFQCAHFHVTDALGKLKVVMSCPELFTLPIQKSEASILQTYWLVLYCSVLFIIVVLLLTLKI